MRTIHEGKLNGVKIGDTNIWPRSDCWIVVENIVLAEFLWEKNAVPAEKTSWIVLFSG